MTAEPLIVVNGQSLTSGQAMLVRMAVTTYHGEMLRPMAIGVAGEQYRLDYLDRLTEVLGFIWAMENGGCQAVNNGR